MNMINLKEFYSSTETVVIYIARKDKYLIKRIKSLAALNQLTFIESSVTSLALGSYKKLVLPIKSKTPILLFMKES